jgi:hypothetical protein
MAVVFTSDAGEPLSPFSSGGPSKNLQPLLRLTVWEMQNNMMDPFESDI